MASATSIFRLVVPVFFLLACACHPGTANDLGQLKYKGYGVSYWRQVMLRDRHSSVIPSHLSPFSTPDPDATALFGELLKDRDPYIRMYTLSCIRVLGKNGAPLVDKVVHCLDDEDCRVVQYAVLAMGAIKSREGNAFSRLFALYYSRPSLSLICLASLIEIEPADKQLYDLLLDFIYDPKMDYGVRVRAVELLSRFDLDWRIISDTVVTILTCANDEHGGICGTAAEVAARLNGCNDQLISALEKTMNCPTKSDYARIQSAAAIWKKTGDRNRCLAVLLQMAAKQQGMCCSVITLIETLAEIAAEDPKAIEGLEMIAQIEKEIDWLNDKATAAIRRAAH